MNINMFSHWEKHLKENLISNLLLKNEIFAGGVLAAGIHLSSFSKKR